MTEVEAQAAVAAAVHKNVGEVRNKQKAHLKRHRQYPVRFKVIGTVEGYSDLVEFSAGGNVEREEDDTIDSNPTAKAVLEAIRKVVSPRRWRGLVDNLLDGMQSDTALDENKKQEVAELLSAITNEKPKAGAVKFRAFG